MKERSYPVYTVNKHAEGLLVGGHPWVYENDITAAPETLPKTVPWPMWSAPRALTWAQALSPTTARSGCGSSAATPTIPLTPASGAAGWSTPGPTARPCWSPPIFPPAG